MKTVIAVLIAMVAVMAVIGFAAADRLPNQTPENQLFSIDTVIDATGAVSDAASMNWVLTNKDYLQSGIMKGGQVIADTTFDDSILTNGGKLAENKNFGFDSRNMNMGTFNINNQKVLTYASTEGAHMVGEEEYTLSVAGNYGSADGNIRCVFSTYNLNPLPAFCNIVSAKSTLVNINSAQVSSKGQIRSVAMTSDIPAGLKYQIAVTPDANSGSGFAEGTVRTLFQGSIMEARDGGDSNYLRNGLDPNFADANSIQPPWKPATWNKTAATNTWKDSTEVTGGIKTLQKAFNYQSGLSTLSL